MVGSATPGLSNIICKTASTELTASLMALAQSGGKLFRNSYARSNWRRGSVNFSSCRACLAVSTAKWKFLCSYADKATGVKPVSETLISEQLIHFLEVGRD